MQNRFVVLFIGRAGSSYLRELLNSHRMISMRPEILVKFKEEGDAKGQMRIVRQVLFSPAPKSYAHCLGFKTKLRDVLDQEAFSTLLQESSCSIISLKRYNIVKHAVSRLNARRLFRTQGLWNITSNEQSLGPLTIEPCKLRELIIDMQEQQREIDVFVNNLRLPTMEVFYEDLLDNKEQCLQRICCFLGAPYLNMRSNLLKNTDNCLEGAIENFPEVCQEFLGSEYYHLLFQ